jgi:hypothetical protein
MEVLLSKWFGRANAKQLAAPANITTISLVGASAAATQASTDTATATSTLTTTDPDAETSSSSR